MATIETLIAQVADPALRERLASAIAEMKSRLDWGLVFERHLPERALLLDAPIRVGTAVWERRSTKPRRLRVRAIESDELVVAVEPENTTAPDDAPTERIARADVLVEHDLSRPIYPLLRPIGEVRNGPSDRPSHAVICGENFDALEVLLATHPASFDVIYLDPPYNTGARDWSYNNDYADPNDSYRSSKWLAFMERRLRLARRLVKPDGVMVITIDEREVIHLGMLLEQTFPEARTQMVSIVINNRGVNRGAGVARVDEQAFFILFGNAPAPIGYGDDLLNERPDTKRANSVRWEWLLRGGPGSTRADRPGLFYPVLIDRDAHKVAGAGDSLLAGDPDLNARVDACEAAWPIRTDGSQGRWHVGQEKLRRLIEKGYVRLGGYDPKRRTWTILYVPDRAVADIENGTIAIVGRDANGVVSLDYANKRTFSVKTVWNRSRHEASIYGSTLLTAFLGERDIFSFPKSLYAVADTLDILTHDRPDARILDFFAGSGTTLHATMLLNARDGGRRQCVIATNNEVRAEVADTLVKEGHFRGDPEFEAAGVFESATAPRIRAAISGIRPDGKPVEGVYLDERPYAEGFEENCTFCRLDYHDGPDIEFGWRFAEMDPLLWFWAGGIGDYQPLPSDQAFAVAANSPYAVLFTPAGLPGLLEAIKGRPDLTHVFIVADSSETFIASSSRLPGRLTRIRLYADFLAAVRSAVR
jgi:adenine-specific DNA-methyltransferase